MSWLWKKKVNPLKSDVELAATDVVTALDVWAGSVDEKEVINLVLEWRIRGTSVHGKPYSVNPKSIYKGKVPYIDPQDFKTRKSYTDALEG